MFRFRRAVRSVFNWSHRWLGITLGVFFCLLAGSGGIVTFRPQIASLLSPPTIPVASCVSSIDWNRVERQVEEFGHSKINRIYAPTAPDSRYRFRMMTERDSIFDHVIYDGCAGEVIGTANLAWMDWLVDFHHNLRFARTGRFYGGWLGVVLLVSGISGLIIWLVSSPSVSRLFRIRSGPFLNRDLHSLCGVLAASLLILGSFTGIWLCFPQAMRAGLKWFAPLPLDARPPRPAKRPEGTPVAGLGEIIASAQRAIPGATWREIRMPEGNGNVQVRMWLPGDFRSLGNNVVTVDRATAAAVATDLYSAKPAPSRFIQAMSGLHYGEWGGLLFRSLYGISGLVSVLLLITGVIVWWLPRRRKAAISAQQSFAQQANPADEAVSIH